MKSKKKRSLAKTEHFFPRIQVKTKKKVFTKNETRRIARNSQWGDLRPMGVWGRSLQLPEAGGLGAEPPALENFAFFCKNSLILELF